MITQELLSQMCQARRQLQEEFEPPSRVSTLAKHVGLSTEHFISQFRALFGETPLQCRQRARLDRALDLLRSTSEPATQIALSLGFAAPGSFSRVFVRNVGLSPRVFRARATAVTVQPPGCVELMNKALSGDLNFGEVGKAAIGHDPASMIK